MKTKIVKIDPSQTEKSEKDLEEAAHIIREGGLVAFPTETVYGLGANALCADAAKKIYEAKGRPSDNPLIAHVADVKGFEELCRIENREAFDILVRHFIPGPITVIQKKKEHIPSAVTAGLDTLAVRFPSHTVARALIERAGVPIAAPSANTSGRPSPTRAAHVIEDMDGKIDMIIDGGFSSVGVESTIVLVEEGGVKVLRPGGVTPAMLTAAGLNVSVDRAVLEKLSPGERPLAPGMKYRHYAPKAPVIGIKGEDSAVVAFLRAKAGEDGVGILCFDGDVPPRETVITLGKKEDKEEQARRLFDALRAFDTMKAGKIYARIPDDGDLGLAVVNRLLKACGYTVMEVGS